MSYYEVELYEHRKYILGVDAENPEDAKNEALKRYNENDYLSEDCDIEIAVGEVLEND